MVLRCNGFSQETPESALNRVTGQALDSPFNSITNKNPALSQNATGNKRADRMVTFILIIHGYSYVDGVKLFVKGIDGVKSVKGDSNSIKLEVSGLVDPLKVRELVERKTKRKVELIFHSADQVQGDRCQNQVSEEKLKKKKIPRNGIANKKTEESIYVLKIKLCCDSCNQKLKKIMKIKGLETVSMDVEKDLVTVKGTMDMTEVRSCIKDELKKDVVIIFPAEVNIPTKKDNGAAYKKEKDAGITGKKDRDDEGKDTNKKDKGSNDTFNRKYRDTVIVDEKFKGNEGIAAVHVKEKSTKEIDEKVKGSATMDDKYKDKDNEKDNGGSRDTKNKASGGGGKKAEDGDGDGDAIRKENAKTCFPYDERKVNRKIYYNYDSNGLVELFSDENPHSCFIL